MLIDFDDGENPENAAGADDEKKQSRAPISKRHLECLAWVLENTRVLSGSEISRSLAVCKTFKKVEKPSFWRMKSRQTWESLPDTFLERPKDNKGWREFYLKCYSIFGLKGEQNCASVTKIAKGIKEWMKENAPKVHATLAPGASFDELRTVLSHFPKSHRTHNRDTSWLAMWTIMNGQKTNGSGPLALFGGFQAYDMMGYLHMPRSDFYAQILRNQRRQDPDQIPYFGVGIQGPRQSVQILSYATQLGELWKSPPSHAQYQLQYPQKTVLGFCKWYHDSLHNGIFRVRNDGGIDRMPRNDPLGSETITDGLKIKVCSLYIPERGRRHEKLMTYQFELEPAEGKESEMKVGQLSSRHFRCMENGSRKDVDGPGVIGLHPEIGPDMKPFRYNSCFVSTFEPGTENYMEGHFTFDLVDGGSWDAKIGRYTFDPNTSPIV